MSGGGTSSGTHNHHHHHQQQQLACLFTRHKTQKRKVWQDGRLVLNPRSCRAILHDADPPAGSGDPSLGECEISSVQCMAMLQQHSGTLETERYLIEVEGPWKAAAPATSPTATNRTSNPTTNTNNGSTTAPAGRPASDTRSSTATRGRTIGKRNVSSSMRKLLASKFQKPRAYVPPPPGDPSHTSQMERVLAKRKRPLQPGEWMAMHHGGGIGSDIGSGGSGNSGGRNHRFGRNQPPHPHPHPHPHPQHSHNPYKENGRMVGSEHGRDLHSSRPIIQQRQPQGFNHRQDAYRTPESGPSSFGVSRGDPGTATPDSMLPRSNASHPTQPLQLQLQQQQQQQQQQRSGFHSHRQGPDNHSHGFVQNDFDAARYYGVDGDDEEDDEEGEPEETSAAPSFSVTMPASDNNPSSSSRDQSSAALPRSDLHPYNVDSHGQNRVRDERHDEQPHCRSNTVTDGPATSDRGPRQHQHSLRREQYDDRRQQQNKQKQQQDAPTDDGHHQGQIETQHHNGRTSLSRSSSAHLHGNNSENRLGNQNADNGISSLPSNPEEDPCGEQNGDASKIGQRQAPRSRCTVDADEEESESDSEEEDEDGDSTNDGFPSSFRLKPFESSTGGDAERHPNRGFATTSGNQLLALFGAANPSRDSSRDSNHSHNQSHSDDELSVGSNRNHSNHENNLRGNNELDEGKENSVPKQQGGPFDTSCKPETAADAVAQVTDGCGTDNSSKPMQGGSDAGFYLPPAATSSEEESSDEDDSDEE